MFEQEVEFEKETSSVVPLLLIGALVLAIIGTGVYLYKESKTVLSTEQASALVMEALKAQTARATFHSGLVVPSVSERPDNPNYQLLEKAGVIKRAKAKEGAANITVAPEWEKELNAYPEFDKTMEKDGTTAYRVPLAERKLAQVPKVTMISPSVAKVEYTWKWEPNKLGNLFDASGSTVKSFPTWARSALIEKYGADYYSGEPKTSLLTVVRTKSGWQVSVPED